jgi:tripartite-type tricarboxylate transporter receptor subunit TctC
MCGDKGRALATHCGRARALACALVSSLLCLSAAPAAGTELFEGRTITILAAGSAGGGYDSYARLLSRHLGRHLPGSPQTVVKMVPGAGGITLANRMFHSEPRDGTSIGIFPGSNAFMPLLSAGKFEYDPTKFGWLASLDKFVPIVLAWHTTPFHSYDDAKTRPMAIGASGFGSQSWGYPKFQNAFLGTKFNVISGFPGSAEITLAIERGELDGYSAWCWTCAKAQKPDWVSGKKIRVLLQLSFEGDPELDAMGVPTLEHVLKTDIQRQLAAVMFGSVLMSRPFMAPPDVPADRLNALRAGIRAAAADPAMQAEGRKLGIDVMYVSPEQIASVMERAYSTKPELLQQLQQALSNR